MTTRKTPSDKAIRAFMKILSQEEHPAAFEIGIDALANMLSMRQTDKLAELVRKVK